METLEKLSLYYLNTRFINNEFWLTYLYLTSEYVNWVIVTNHLTFKNTPVIEKYKDKIKWVILSHNLFKDPNQKSKSYYKERNDFIIKFRDHLDWERISRKYLSLEILESCKDYID